MSGLRLGNQAERLPGGGKAEFCGRPRPRDLNSANEVLETLDLNIRQRLDKQRSSRDFRLPFLIEEACSSVPARFLL